MTIDASSTSGTDKSIASLRDQAHAQMEALGIPATPENYAFWFAYAEGHPPELSRAVNVMLAKGGPLDKRRLAELAKGLMPEGPHGADLKHVSREVIGGLDDALKLLTEALGNIGEFRASLEMADKRLVDNPASAEVQVLTALLLAAVRRTLLRNAQIGQQLENSRQRIACLQEEVASLSKDATTDSLTGLLNRRAFDAALTRLVSSSRQSGDPVSLMIGDLDHFKRLNDTHGHPVGDHVLKFTSQVLREHGREGDIICRYGGEEFALLLPSTALQAACSLAERLRRAIHEKAIVKRGTGETLGRVSISFGVAELGRDGTGEALVRTADQRLYTSKQAGRNRVTPSADGLRPRRRA